MDPSDKPFEELRTICDHLVERTATLFVGAGVNAGLLSSEGVPCPFAADLSKWLCADLLTSPETEVPLDEATEMARHSVGERVFNDYLFDKFSKYSPGVAHLGLVQLPWDKIYTTNFDMLLEQAASSEVVQSAGSLRVITSTTADVSVLSEEDIPYYKLHGSLDIANTFDGKLILTKKDYREYEKYKKPLFKRLKTDIESRTFVFIGYSLIDTNFRAVLDDCRDELGVQTLPLSYAIVHNCTPIQKEYWRDRYNIELIICDVVEFVTLLRETWINENCAVVPLLQRRSSEYLRLDTSSRFQKVGDSFYLLRTSDVTGKSNPKAFFRGAEPTWEDIRDKIPAQRDLYDTLIEGLFPELLDTTLDPSAYVITGAAGTGKTTLLYTIAYDLVADFQAAVLIHVPGTPLDSRSIAPLVEPDILRRFVVVVRYASEQFRELAMFYQDVIRQKLPVTLLLEDRTNQWHVAKTSYSTKFDPIEFTLGSLSSNEIGGIIDTLSKFDCLEKLSGLTRPEQVSHFNELASDDLLVALRELTSINDFDQIVRDEYEKIPSEIAKQAYIYVAAIGQLDLAIRYETIIRVLNLTSSQLAQELLNPTEGILIVGEDTGSSRHNIGFRLRARHPIIASVIFALAADNDAKKFVVINGILTELDPGYPEDMRLLRELMKRKELVNTLEEHAMRRALFERLETILPGDPYVWQHRSIIERDMKDVEQAVRFARMATKSEPSNLAFSNNLGFALEFAARSAEDPLKIQALLSEASKLFEEGISKNSSDPYNYLGQINILRQRFDREKDKDAKKVLFASILSLLVEAYDETDEAPMIAAELAKVRKQLGSPEEGISIIRQALLKKSGDGRLRDLLIHFLDERGKYAEALLVAIEGARLDPTSWRIQRWLARLRQQGTENVKAVRGAYEAAIRHRKGDVGLMVEHASYLFRKLMLDEAAVQFAALNALSMSAQDRRRVRERWNDGDQGAKVFEGKIDTFAGAKGTIVAVPENFRVFFWRTAKGANTQREGDRVKFNVVFSAQGAEAKILNVRVPSKLHRN